MLCTSIGTLRYSIVPDVGYKLIVEVDQEIVNYYLKLIPKYKGVTRQRYAAHISVVRKETPVISNWCKYEGKEIEFIYDTEVKSGTVYYWLNVFSKELEYIRMELGLPVSTQYTLPPEGFVKAFHCTIGNIKGL